MSLIQGKWGEDLACRYLVDRGLKLVERNFRSPFGEIDLVMRDNADLVFVEVRVRRNSRYGSGADTVDYRKQRKLTATALHYLQATRHSGRQPSRFDVVSICAGTSGGHDLTWIRDAFHATHLGW